MRKSRFTDAQIICVIKEHDAGVATKELCRKHGISTNTLYKWKSKFGGMEVSDVTKMRALQDENRRLRKVVTDLVLEKEALKIIAEGNLYIEGRHDDMVELQPASGWHGNGYPAGKLRPFGACLEDADPFHVVVQ